MNKTVQSVAAQKYRLLIYGFFVSLAFSLAIAVFIFCMSQEDIPQSASRSGGFTEILIRLFYKDYGSLTPEEQTLIISSWQTPIRKIAHITEFAALAFFTASLIAHKRVRPVISFPIAFIFSCLYAASDEIHQIFSHRGASVIDVLIDCSGVIIGLSLFHLLCVIIHRIQKRKIYEGNSLQTADSDT